MKPEDVSGEAGEEIILVCQADGNPPPTYRWFRNHDMNTVSEIIHFYCSAWSQPSIQYIPP